MTLIIRTKQLNVLIKHTTIIFAYRVSHLKGVLIIDAHCVLYLAKVSFRVHDQVVSTVHTQQYT